MESTVFFCSANKGMLDHKAASTLVREIFKEASTLDVFRPLTAIFLCGCHQALNSSDLGVFSVGYGNISYLMVLVQMIGKSLCECCYWHYGIIVLNGL